MTTRRWMLKMARSNAPDPSSISKAVSIEHALWGNFLFTVGIGWFFYSGAIR